MTDVWHQLLAPLDPRELPPLTLTLADQGLPHPLRASALPFCPRYWCLWRLLPASQRPDPTISFVRKAITASGTVLHALAQHWLRRLLYGDWECPGCGQIQERTAWHQRLSCRSRTCSRRGYPLRYRELELRHPRVPLTGHPDGIIVQGVARPLVLEIKIIDEAKLTALTAPVDAHVYQTSAYARLLRYPPHELHPREVLFMYLNRNLPFRNSVWQAEAAGALHEVLQGSSGYAARPLLKVFRHPVSLSLIEAELATIQRALRTARHDRVLTHVKWRRCADVTAAAQTFCALRYVCFASWTDALLHANRRQPG